MSPERGPQVNFAELFSKSAEFDSISKAIDSSMNQFDSLEAAKTERYTVGSFTQYKEVLLRELRETLRNPASFFLQIIQTLLMAFVVGSVFYQVGYSQAAIQARVGVLFFILTSGAFTLSASAGSFVEGRLLVNRERAVWGKFCVRLFCFTHYFERLGCIPVGSIFLQNAQSMFLNTCSIQSCLGQSCIGWVA
jgi:hypothetical protein